ncbi:MAG: hypothetical protein EON60_06325 [Alphaproteobacteria bacterium]|nr:MAG: hypothetical protein EON60_06325 [Alphaproteobacteria bacterium]
MTSMHDDLNNPATAALWGKVVEGFKYISGSGWENRANYEHFWSLVRHLYKLAYGEKAELPVEYKASLAFMFAGHAGRIRKGIRPRPYFHHILMVVYLAWLLRLPSYLIAAAIHHDDIEDIPKNLGVTDLWVIAELKWLISEPSLETVVNLTNKQHPDGKHAGQMEKMATIHTEEATLKLIDRICNLWDMRRDKPKDFTPDRIRQECTNAQQLADAMPTPAPPEVLALLRISINLLLKENSLTPA